MNYLKSETNCISTDNIMCVCSAVSNSLKLPGLKTTRLLCSWDFRNKITGMGCHALLQGSSRLRDLTHVSCVSCIGRWILYHYATWASKHNTDLTKFINFIKKKKKSIFPLAQLVKTLPAMQETWVQSLGWEDPLEKGKATHHSILAWRIPCKVHGVTKSQTRLSNFHFYFKST